MSHIIPYISSEPPPIQNDSFDGDLEESDLSKSHISIPQDVPHLTKKEICDESQSKTKSESHFIISDNISHLDNIHNFEQLNMNKSIENDNCIDVNDEILSQCSDQNEFSDEIELELNNVSNIANVDTEYNTYPCENEETNYIEENLGDQVDYKDGTGVNIPNDSVHEILSQCSDEDQFSDELNDFFGYDQEGSKKDEMMDYEDTNDKLGDKKANDNFFHNNFDNVNENEDNFADFNQVDFPSFDMVDHNSTEVIIAKETNEKVDGVDEEDDDFNDFTDFSTFQTVTKDEDLEKPTIEKAKLNLNELLDTFNDLISTIEINHESHGKFGEICKFDNLFEYNKESEEIWRELINFDYSPAFQFQWMQSRLCEKFMSSLGEEYLEILQSHKATLPIYSVNLTPIEPVPFICPSNNSVSASPQSSSNLDLTHNFGKDQSPTTQSSHSSNQTIDFKNLEEEFACESKSSEFVTVSHNLSDFNTASSPQTNTTNTNDVTHNTNLGNLSTDVFIQSESFGGHIIKSLLKPLSNNTNINSCTTVTNNNINKTSPMSSSALVNQLHPQSQAVIRDLPDLSYMTSKVLMFPVLSTCESTEDNL